MIWESGKLLTAEQTARLARMNGEDRYRNVQLIAERLRNPRNTTNSAMAPAHNTDESAAELERLRVMA